MTQLLSVNKFVDYAEAELKFEEKDAESGVFKGYASTFNSRDQVGDTIMPGAFSNEIAKGRPVKMFLNHGFIRNELPIGKFSSLKEDRRGLLASGELTLAIGRARDTRAAMRAGTVDGLSVCIGMKEGDFEIGTTDKGLKQRKIHNVSLLKEISVVTFPMDDAARIDVSSVKSELDCVESIRDFEDFLRESGNFSKGLAQAVVSRAKQLFGTGDPELDVVDAKAASAELVKLFENFSLPTEFLTKQHEG